MGNITAAELIASIADVIGNVMEFGCGGSKYRGKNEKWFKINRAKGTLKNYTPSGKKKKPAKGKKR